MLYEIGKTFYLLICGHSVVRLFYCIYSGNNF